MAVRRSSGRLSTGPSVDRVDSVHSRVDESTAGAVTAVTVGNRPVTRVDSSRSCPQECAQVGEISCVPGHVRSRVAARPAGVAAPARVDRPRLTCAIIADVRAGVRAGRAPAPPADGLRHDLGTAAGDAGDRGWRDGDRGAQPSSCPRVDNRKTLTTHNRPTGPFGGLSSAKGPDPQLPHL